MVRLDSRSQRTSHDRARRGPLSCLVPRRKRCGLSGAASSQPLESNREINSRQRRRTPAAYRAAGADACSRPNSRRALSSVREESRSMGSAARRRAGGVSAHCDLIHRESRTRFNGRWLAFTSNVTGESQVYVTSFPVPGEHLRISRNGGSDPQWRDDGRELYYVSTDQTFIAVPR